MQLHDMETLKQWSQVYENFDANEESVVCTAGTNNLGIPNANTLILKGKQVKIWKHLLLFYFGQEQYNILKF